MKLDQLLRTTPETLAKEQHDALKAHALSVLSDFSKRISEENYKGARMLTYTSPAGDCMGSDDTCIDFSYTETHDTSDLGDLLDKLEALKEMFNPKTKKGKA
jgi:hypothetical protein